jgi:putative transposase
MRKFKSVEQAQRFLSAHASIDNLFNLGRHLLSAENYRYFRLRAFASWEKAAAL